MPGEMLAGGSVLLGMILFAWWILWGIVWPLMSLNRLRRIADGVEAIQAHLIPPAARTPWRWEIEAARKAEAAGERIEPRLQRPADS